MASAAVLPKKPGADYTPPRLRDATSADADALATLFSVARPNAGVNAKGLRDYLALSSALLVVSASGQALAALMYREDADGWRVEPIVTHPDHRGQGYGRWLMTMLEADAIRSNVSFLAVTITDPNVLSYYLRLGYRAVDSNPLELRKRVGGVWQRQGAGA